MRIDGMSIPHADRVSLPWLFAASLLSSKPFPDVMIFFLKAVGYNNTQIEGIMFRNAVRFLGLSKGEREEFGENSMRARLEKFYAVHNLSTDWMSVFD